MITLTNIEFSYHRKKILHALSFSQKTGTCVGLVGGNGCGKSTLLSILAGIRKQDSGIYTLNDSPATQKRIRREIGYVPQDNPLIPDLTVKDNLTLWYAGTPYSYQEEMKNGILSMLALDSCLHMPVHKLSGGMKKRVSIAIALSNHPKLLLLDEPSTALDLICKKEIRAYLEHFKKQGGTILFTTHDETELDLCDELYGFHQGALKKLPLSLRGNALLETISNKIPGNY